MSPGMEKSGGAHTRAGVIAPFAGAGRPPVSCRITLQHLKVEEIMETAREFCVHELNDILDAERRILKALGEQIEECERPDLKKLFQSHRAQTEKQIQRLEQCFQELDEEPEQQECHGIIGLIEEHDHFKEEDPSEELLDVFNCGAAAKVEHYEIAAYTSIINLCKQLGLRKAERLLNQNLSEEEQMLKRVEALSKKMKISETGMEEEEEIEEAPSRSRQRRAA
jgi:ferritin-like metal-binding protein YciE